MSERYLYRPGHPQADEFNFVRAEIAGPLMRNVKSVQVLSDVAPFVSPIDKSVISSRSHLREHEKRHGVRQLGNDWCGEKPSFWDRRQELARSGKADDA